MNRTENNSSVQQSLTIQQAIDLAVQHHNADRLYEAENIYQQILKVVPNQPVVLHLLGVIALQAGEYDRAVDLITRAISLKPDYADALSNLGNVFRAQGRLTEAVDNYHKVLAIEPDSFMAQNNLGVAFMALGEPHEAVNCYRKALVIKSDYNDAHYNLGNALVGMGQLDDAVISFQAALAIKPSPDTYYILGNTFLAQGKVSEAVASYNNSLVLNPEGAHVYCNLGAAFQILGNRNEAFQNRRQAVSLDPENISYWTGLAEALEGFVFSSVDDNLWRDLLQLLGKPTVRPAYVTGAVISALRLLPEFSRVLECTTAENPEIDSAYSELAGQLSLIPIFLRILSLDPLADLQIERMLTALRHAMLTQNLAGKTDEKELPFSVALALQCFANEYIYQESEEEKAGVEHLAQQIAALMEQSRDVSPCLIAALGAYRSLYQFPWAEDLCNHAWTGHMADLIRRQISEPLEERSMGAQITCLTPIDNTVSQMVREQYEQNPYPRWTKTFIHNESRPIGAVLQGFPLLLDLGEYVSPENPEILVAGCGTGRHALNMASRFSNSRMFAVDLSLSSLAYAMRKTRDLSIENINYAQGDIMELGRQGLQERQFDLIECSGVLHHLADPLAGWRVLVGLLRPGGLMNIALYSEAARHGVVSGRSLISEKGYSSSPEDIRRCRQDFIVMAKDGDPAMTELCKGGDFFSLSNCRDLFFHVQEHRFTLPQIEAALDDFGLRFLGFEMRDQSALRKFREDYPNSSSLTILEQWHEFELDNPETFLDMYQFWCMKV